MNPVLQRVITLSVSLVFSIHPAIAEENDPSRAVRQVLTEFHQTYGFPGATVAYATEDGTVASFAVGFADVEAGTPMTPESRMLAASIGKTVWGALVLSLETDGVLSRSDLVSTYLGDRPWFARVPNAAKITIGQLGNHTSGLPDHVHMDGVAKELIDLGEEEFDPVDLISFIFDEPPLFEAGSNWAYSDTGYVLLGLAIEAATGRDVFDLAQERFLTPLGLSATSPSLKRRIDGLAVGYTNDANPFGLAPRTMDEAGRLTWNPVVEWTGGGFASTSSDLAVWARAFCGKRHGRPVSGKPARWRAGALRHTRCALRNRRCSLSDQPLWARLRPRRLDSRLRVKPAALCRPRRDNRLSNQHRLWRRGRKR